MEVFDVAVVGGGPAGSSCAALCASTGLKTILLEREKFPREKVCGDCLNPHCWPILERLGVADALRNHSLARLEAVEFVAIGGTSVKIPLPADDGAELAIKRSVFDQTLLRRARELGAETREACTVTALARANSVWQVEAGETYYAKNLVGADGRNSSVARLCNLASRPRRERIALQSHIPLPNEFGNRVVLQFRPEGYSGQAPVSETELNVCLVARPREIDALKQWALRKFDLPLSHPWRTITPLTRAPTVPAHAALLLIGDAARVVEPFTGEGIYYALRSGELAAAAIAQLVRGKDEQSVLREFSRAWKNMYTGRLWINRLARYAVLSPRLASSLAHFLQGHPAILRMLTARIVR